VGIVSIVERLDRAQLEEILNRATERLTGDWLLVGGALVALWLEGRRTTEDVDLIPLNGAPEERYALMDLASELGLPIEAVNSAADYFVRRIEGWREELEPFLEGSRATIYRPTPTLFLLFKLRRLTAQDLQDCLAVIARSRAENLSMDVERVRAAVAELPATTDPALAERRAALLSALPP
jgi:hypothetical protein